MQDFVIHKEINLDFGFSFLPVELVTDHVWVVYFLLEVASLLLKFLVDFSLCVFMGDLGSLWSLSLGGRSSLTDRWVKVVVRILKLVWRLSVSHIHNVLVIVIMVATAHTVLRLLYIVEWILLVSDKPHDKCLEYLEVLLLLGHGCSVYWLHGLARVELIA